MSAGSPSTGLEELIAASAWPSRIGLRVLLALGRRPRGFALLRRFPPADHAAEALLAMSRYDQPTASLRLGWDAEGVVARGRRLRRSEGRP